VLFWLQKSFAPSPLYGGGGWGVRLPMYVNVAFFKYKEPPPAGGLLNNQVIVLVFFKSSCGGYKGALFRTVERLSGVCYE